MAYTLLIYLVITISHVAPRSVGIYDRAQGVRHKAILLTNKGIKGLIDMSSPLTIQEFFPCAVSLRP